MNLNSNKIVEKELLIVTANKRNICLGGIRNNTNINRRNKKLSGNNVTKMQKARFRRDENETQIENCLQLPQFPGWRRE